MANPLPVWLLVRCYKLFEKWNSKFWHKVILIWVLKFSLQEIADKERAANEKVLCSQIIDDPFYSVTLIHLVFFNEPPKCKAWNVLETALSHLKTYCSPLSLPWLIRYFFRIMRIIAADKINRCKIVLKHLVILSSKEMVQKNWWWRMN